MFTKTSKHYDAVYSYKDYESESELVSMLVSVSVYRTPKHFSMLPAEPESIWST
jgi:hypothetical protein